MSENEDVSLEKALKEQKRVLFEKRIALLEEEIRRSLKEKERGIYQFLLEEKIRKYLEEQEITLYESLDEKRIVLLEESIRKYLEEQETSLYEFLVEPERISLKQKICECLEEQDLKERKKYLNERKKELLVEQPILEYLEEQKFEETIRKYLEEQEREAFEKIIEVETHNYLCLEKQEISFYDFLEKQKEKIVLSGKSIDTYRNRIHKYLTERVSLKRAIKEIKSVFEISFDSDDFYESDCKMLYYIINKSPHIVINIILCYLVFCVLGKDAFFPEYSFSIIIISLVILFISLLVALCCMINNLMLWLEFRRPESNVKLWLEFHYGYIIGRIFFVGFIIFFIPIMFGYLFLPLFTGCWATMVLEMTKIQKCVFIIMALFLLGVMFYIKIDSLNRNRIEKFEQFNEFKSKQLYEIAQTRINELKQLDKSDQMRINELKQRDQMRIKKIKADVEKAEKAEEIDFSPLSEMRYTRRDFCFSLLNTIDYPYYVIIDSTNKRIDSTQSYEKIKKKRILAFQRCMNVSDSLYDLYVSSYDSLYKEETNSLNIRHKIKLEEIDSLYIEIDSLYRIRDKIIIEKKIDSLTLHRLHRIRNNRKLLEWYNIKKTDSLNIKFERKIDSLYRIQDKIKKEKIDSLTLDIIRDKIEREIDLLNIRRDIEILIWSKFGKYYRFDIEKEISLLDGMNSLWQMDLIKGKIDSLTLDIIRDKIEREIDLLNIRRDIEILIWSKFGKYYRFDIEKEISLLDGMNSLWQMDLIKGKIDSLNIIRDKIKEGKIDSLNIRRDIEILIWSKFGKYYRFDIEKEISLLDGMNSLWQMDLIKGKIDSLKLDIIRDKIKGKIDSLNIIRDKIKEGKIDSLTLDIIRNKIEREINSLSIRQDKIEEIDLLDIKLEEKIDSLYRIRDNEEKIYSFILYEMQNKIRIRDKVINSFVSKLEAIDDTTQRRIKIEGEIDSLNRIRDEIRIINSLCKIDSLYNRLCEVEKKIFDRKDIITSNERSIKDKRPFYFTYLGFTGKGKRPTFLELNLLFDNRRVMCIVDGDTIPSFIINGDTIPSFNIFAPLERKFKFAPLERKTEFGVRSTSFIFMLIADTTIPIVIRGDTIPLLSNKEYDEVKSKAEICKETVDSIRVARNQDQEELKILEEEWKKERNKDILIFVSVIIIIALLLLASHLWRKRK